MLCFRNLAMTTGPRTYYLIGDLVRLERALVQFALQKLRQKVYQMTYCVRKVIIV